MSTWTMVTGRPQKLAWKVLLLLQALFSVMPPPNLLLPISRAGCGAGVHTEWTIATSFSKSRWQIPSVRNQGHGKHCARCVHIKTEMLF